MARLVLRGATVLTMDPERRALEDGVVGAGFLDELPEAAFTTRFNPQ
jgi:hypothetical protein